MRFDTFTSLHVIVCNGLKFIPLLVRALWIPLGVGHGHAIRLWNLRIQWYTNIAFVVFFASWWIQCRLDRFNCISRPLDPWLLYGSLAIWTLEISRVPLGFFSWNFFCISCVMSPFNYSFYLHWDFSLLMAMSSLCAQKKHDFVPFRPVLARHNITLQVIYEPISFINSGLCYWFLEYRMSENGRNHLGSIHALLGFFVYLLSSFFS